MSGGVSNAADAAMRLVVVEDSMEVRNRLIALLALRPDIDIVGHAATESDAIKLIDQTRPDTILLDINLAMGNGVRVLESIRYRGSCAYVIVMTSHTHEAYRELCLRLGADEFRDKALEFSSLLESLQARAAALAEGPIKAGP